MKPIENNLSINNSQNINNDPESKQGMDGSNNDIEKSEFNEYKKFDYVVRWIVIRDTQRIALNSNLLDSLTTDQIIEKNKCIYLISGSFFDQENNHIGLFISNKNILSSPINDNFFNGYLSINEKGTVLIDQKIQSDSEYALQSGPILLLNEKYIDIKSLNNDKKSRRIVAAIDRRGDLYFFVIFDPNNYISGPFLAEAGEIIKSLEEDSNVDLVSAINLDGGTHSAFITKSTKIKELTEIGSYFCYR